MSVFGMNIKVQTFDEGLYRLAKWKVELALVLALVLLAWMDSSQAAESLNFIIDQLIGLSPYLLVSIGLTAYAKATGADNLIARAFKGKEPVIIIFASLMGGLSPFCSCGVIPLIAALLSMGVPLAPVMAFWLSSPLMDPSMFFLTAGTLGMKFALFKTFSAVAVGILGGYGTYFLIGNGLITNPLREGIGSGGCGGSVIRNPKQIIWKFWTEEERKNHFFKSSVENLIFLGKWMAIAFFLESLMLAYLPAEMVAHLVGDDGWGAVMLASVVGIPAYLNGYAALPLVAGLIEQGMAPGAGMAFLLAGGVSCIPAAIAVWALARPPVFAAYLGFAFIGACVLGLSFGYII
ncbi:MAG TPA: permease [SAR324 cluster bacterium]|jgi:hypothetical protein|nr:permease [SAR324 cluster bacterium]HJM07032.1 permease [SAR324 cluster bacterium]|tara:strand:+ start:2204 stop:3250 length:1047 start_codon:yes stop_codon:yes gene_type:complete